MRRGGGFFRYLCFYCASRFIYSTVRDATRHAPCSKHGSPPVPTQAARAVLLGFAGGALVVVGGLLVIFFAALLGYM